MTASFHQLSLAILYQTETTRSISTASAPLFSPTSISPSWAPLFRLVPDIGILIRVVLAVRVACRRDGQLISQALDPVNAFRDLLGFSPLRLVGDSAGEGDDTVLHVNVDGRVPQVVGGRQGGARLCPEPTVLGAHADLAPQPLGLLHDAHLVLLILLPCHVGVGRPRVGISLRICV